MRIMRVSLLGDLRWSVCGHYKFSLPLKGRKVPVEGFLLRAKFDQFRKRFNLRAELLAAVGVFEDCAANDFTLVNVLEERNLKFPHLRVCVRGCCEFDLKKKDLILAKNEEIRASKARTIRISKLQPLRKQGLR